MKECLLCDDECESVSHVLWECPAYSSNLKNACSIGVQRCAISNSIIFLLQRWEMVSCPAG